MVTKTKEAGPKFGTKFAAKPAVVKAAPKPAAKPGMTDEAVAERTGKTWGEWFTILDEAGGATLEHRAMIALLGEHGVGPIWRQMVAAGYARRGAGEKPKVVVVKKQTADLSAIVTRMVSVTQLAAYAAWDRPTRRKKFLPEEITYSNRKNDKAIRFGWAEDHSRVIVQFTPKSKTRTQVTITHERLKTAADVERMTEYWTEAMDIMQAMVEKTDDD